MGIPSKRLSPHARAMIREQQAELAIEPGGQLTVALDWPPSVNHYWRHVVIQGQVRVLLSAEGRKYQQTATRQLFGKPSFPAHARLDLTILCSAPDRRRYDLDNRVKAVQDALAHAGIYHDDQQIDDLHVIRHPPTPGGQVIVTIRERAGQGRLL